MRTGTITITPFAIAAAREQRRRDFLDLLATVQFWRLRAVEFTLLSLIAFSIGFAIACRL